MRINKGTEFESGDAGMHTYWLKLRLNKLHLSQRYGGQFADYVEYPDQPDVHHIFVHPNIWVLDDEAFKEDWEID